MVNASPTWTGPGHWTRPNLTSATGSDQPTEGGGPAGLSSTAEAAAGVPRSVDRDYWLWPLPPQGRLTVACQWLDQGIEMTRQELDSAPFLEAAIQARPLWPSSDR